VIIGCWLLLCLYFPGSQGDKQILPEEYDEEEFVGFEHILKKKEEDATEQIIQRINQEQKDHIALPPPRTNYYLEYFYGIMIFLYLVNYWIGKSKNDKIAKAWLKDVQDMFDANCTRVGMKNIPTQTLFAEKMIKETNNLYKLKATGRLNCAGVQASLALKKRHDLVTFIIESLFGSYDALTIDVLLEKEMDDFVFACVKKKEEKKYRKNSPDLSAFTKGSQTLEDLNSVAIISELEELIPRLMNSPVVGALNKLNDEFVKIHISDQNLLTKDYKHSLQLEFKLPSDTEKRQAIMKLAFFLVDRVATAEVSKAGKQVAEKHRVKIQEAAMKESIAQRQEAMQQKKIEKIQKEKEKLEKLSPDEQRRHEEKQAKKDAKKRQPKMKVMFG